MDRKTTTAPAVGGDAPAIIPVGIEKFTRPGPPPFTTFQALLSALSLLAFVVTSGAAIARSGGQPWWGVLPFWLTLAGGAVGLAYETWLILTRRPYWLLAPSYGPYVQSLRGGILALVFASTALLTYLLTYGTTGGSDWPILLIVAGAGYLVVMLTFRGPILPIALVITLGVLAEVLWVWTSTELRGGVDGRILLTLAAVGLYATNFIGTQDPTRSTTFHLVGTAVLGLLFFGTAAELRGAAGAERWWGVPVPNWPALTAAAGVGAWLAFRVQPATWAAFRSILANLTWPLFYLVVAGGMRIPKPRRLSDLYRGQEAKLRPLSLYPYYYAHSRNLTHPISIPALDEALTIKVQRLGFLVTLVKFVFGAASVVGRFFPFANLDVPLAVKPRMEPWSDGTEYWPSWLLQRIYVPKLGWFQIESGVKGPGFQKTPDTAIRAYQDGHLLAFLVEYGIAGSFVRVLGDDERPEGDPHAGRTVFRLDFEFLEGYETKPDYEPYGGAADFVVDDASKSLKLVRIRGPRSPFFLPPDPADPRFRHAEDQVLASIYFYVVSGKHLVEIHMGLNLVEVALFNAFDAKDRWAHPVRLALYPHLFAHELAEELTTENLLEDKAVFSQIFATTNSALMRHLNDRFGDYELGHDEDFEGREATLMAGRAPGERLEDVLPRSSLVWEKRYAAIWHEYATRLVEAAFADDAAVAGDPCIRSLFDLLTASFLKPLPGRYDRLASRGGLARFISDTMHHLIIRHEIYGTSGVRLALDPRINKVQVPKDGGAYAVDEWRSLACIAMATSRVRYTLLSTDFSDTFDDLADPAVRAAYDATFATLQARLRDLGDEFAAEHLDDYSILRPLPKDLDIGAGY